MKIEPQKEEALRLAIRQAIQEAAKQGKSLYLAAYEAVTGKQTWGFLDLNEVRKLINEELEK